MQEEKDINLVDVLRRLWSRKKLILIVCLCCFAVAVFLAIFSPRVYKAGCSFVPQTNQSFSAKYSSIASMIGMDLDMGGSDGPISPKVYPEILKNPNFQHDLMYTKIHFKDVPEPISIYDYYTDKKYRKFNIVEAIVQYTVGLPRLIMYAVLPGDDSEKYVQSVQSVSADSAAVECIPALTKSEFKVAKILKKSVKMDVDAKKGILSIDVCMPEALASAEVCQATFDLLKKYVSDFKLAKARKNLEFLEKQYIDVKADYDKKQRSLAYFTDSHSGMMTASAAVERQRLSGEAELAKQLYQELSKNLLSTRVKLEESNVTFTAVNPVSVPAKKFKPRGTTIAVVLVLLGLLGSCGYILIKDAFSQSGKKEEEE